MYNQLDSLLELQNIDNEIDRLESQKALEPGKLKTFEKELRKYKQKLDAGTLVIEDINKARREINRKLDAQQAQMDKYKAQRTAVKTNKEYTALELEISEIEKDIIDLMIELEKKDNELNSAKGDSETAEKDYQDQEAIFQKHREEIITEVKLISKKIAILTKKRDPYLSKVSPTLINKYSDWRKKKGGSLVALIVGENCGGCHLKLPPQLINEVRKKRDLRTCNSCGRILYWKEEVVIEPLDEKKE